MKKLCFLSFMLLCARQGFSQTTDPSPYCEATFDDMDGTFPVDDHINSVQFGNLSNISNAQYAAPHYIFYNNLPVSDFKIDSTYTLNLNFKVSGGCGYGVWIDFNQNHEFEANEKIAGTTGTEFLALGDTTSISKSITIPSDAVSGNTRMRIRIVEDDNHNMNSTDELPCNASNSPTDVMDWGETEDYTVNILAGENTFVQEWNKQPYIELSPNPSNGMVTLRCPEGHDGIVQVYTSSGRLVYQTKAKNPVTTINFRGQAKGLYYVKIIGADKVSVKPLILR